MVTWHRHTHTHCFDQCRLTKLQHSSAASTISFLFSSGGVSFWVEPSCGKFLPGTSSDEFSPGADQAGGQRGKGAQGSARRRERQRAACARPGSAFFGMCACVKIGKTPQMEVSFGFSMSLKSTYLFLFLEEHRTSRGTRGLHIPCPGRWGPPLGPAGLPKPLACGRIGTPKLPQTTEPGPSDPIACAWGKLWNPHPYTK